MPASTNPIMALAMNDLTALPLCDLARLARVDMNGKPPFCCVPYLNAMLTLQSHNDTFGCDSGRSIVLYFLSNATTWRGETARRIKAELKRRVK